MTGSATRTGRFRTVDGFTLYRHSDGMWRDRPEGSDDHDMTFDDADGQPVDVFGEPLAGSFINGG